jgi:hypothetical protein
MRSLLCATTAFTAAGLIAGAAGDVAAQTAPISPSSPRPEQPPEVVPATPAPAPYVSKSAERIKLGLSGFYQQWAVITDQNFKTREVPGGPTAKQPTNTVTNRNFLLW